MVVLLSKEISENDLVGLRGKLPKGARLDYNEVGTGFYVRNELYLNRSHYLKALKRALKKSKKASVISSR